MMNKTSFSIIYKQKKLNNTSKRLFTMIKSPDLQGCKYGLTNPSLQNQVLHCMKISIDQKNFDKMTNIPFTKKEKTKLKGRN